MLRPEADAFTWFWAQFPTFGTDVFGNPSLGDKPVAGDFDGDGRNDPAVVRPGNPSLWLIQRSSTGAVTSLAFGNVGAGDDIPLTGDFDGDGRSDIAVYRPGAPATFIVWLSGGGFLSVPFGEGDDAPFVGDFDGDNRTDIGVRREGANQVTVWFVRFATGAYRAPFELGVAGDWHVPGDYDGDGRNDFVIVRTLGNGNLHWFGTTADGSLVPGLGIDFGKSVDSEVQSDYDGNGTDRHRGVATGEPGRCCSSRPTGPNPSPPTSSAAGRTCRSATSPTAAQNTFACVI